MQKSAEKLTTKRATKAEAKDKRYYIWDSVISGFGMVVQPSGIKSFIFQYRNHQGQRPRIKIGDLGPITVDQARDIARKHYADVAQGKDPRDQVKPTAGGKATVNDLLDWYLASAKFAGMAETTKKFDQGTIKNHLRPLLGRLVIDDMTPNDLEQMALDVTRGKTAAIVKTGRRGKSVIKGGAGSAQTCLRKIKAIFGWGLKQGKITNHPGLTVKAGQNGRRLDYLDADKYSCVFQAMDKLEKSGRLKPVVADAIRLIALTGARRNEICGLRWRQVDLNRKVIVLGKGEHKGGHKASSGSEKIIALPPSACDILARQKKRGPNDRVFVPARGNQSSMININKPWLKIRKEAGVSSKVVIHSLRHSLASHMANNKQDALAIMSVLGHKQIQTSMIYIHLAKKTHRQHADIAASGIASLMNGENPIPEGG